MIRRTALAACLLVLLGASTAPAQEAAVDIQQFKPVTDVDGFVLVHDASLLPQFRFGVGFDLNYAVNPLEVRAVGFGRQFGLYDGLIGGDLYGAFSVFDFFDVGLRFPIMQIPVTTDFVSSPSWPGAKVPYGIGDILIESRIRILDPAEKPVDPASEIAGHRAQGGADQDRQQRRPDGRHRANLVAVPGPTLGCDFSVRSHWS